MTRRQPETCDARELPRPHRVFGGHIESDGSFRATTLPDGIPLRLEISRGEERVVLLDNFMLEQGEIRRGLRFPWPFGEEATTTDLTGVVRDGIDGRVLSGVEVSHRPIRSVTDEAGCFRLEGVPKRSLSIEVTRDGYYRLECRLLVLRSRSSATVGSISSVPKMVPSMRRLCPRAATMLMRVSRTGAAGTMRGDKR
ncbi:MAG: carboxypeptidase-like regulatory domain-containing protein [Planctomycetota bacterium]